MKAEVDRLLTAEETLSLRKDLKAIGANAGTPMRRKQRLAALWLAVRLKLEPVPRETLRDACRILGVYDVALFTHYMKDCKTPAYADKWFVLDRGGGGWILTEKARDEAAKLFP